MAILSNSFNILLIILGFGILVFIHELGHFLAAKWAGIRAEAFAVGMGPIMIAWRKGIGLRFRSTEGEYEQRARKLIAEQSGHAAAMPTHEQIITAGDKLGLGPTEYSLRWLPLGGFVKMLGQEDANPNAVSDHPQSYNRAPIGKRMVVVSAGVIANVILAVVMFMIAFLAGVRVEAPQVGDVEFSSPAAATMADNSAELGVTEPGLRSGDMVTHIDGKEATTFADIQIASAMSKPGEPVRLTVQRPGFSQPLRFTLMPVESKVSGLLAIGILPGRSTQLRDDLSAKQFEEMLADSGLPAAGVKPGMRLVSLEGKPAASLADLEEAVRSSEGRDVQTTWTALDKDGHEVGAPVQASIKVHPRYQLFTQRGAAKGELLQDNGLLGFSPLVKIESVDKASPNAGLLQAGDIVTEVGRSDYPRRGQFMQAIHSHKGQPLDLTLLRDGKEAKVTANVTRKGQLLVMVGDAANLPVIADPVNEQLLSTSDDSDPVPTPVAALNLMPGTRLVSLGQAPIADWPGLRAALQEQTASAAQAGAGAELSLTVEHPTPENPRETLALKLSADDVKALHKLSWATTINSDLFDPIYTTLTADGNPIQAVKMGFKETYKLIVLTYITIDRLFRGSVGVKQLHGPVGIVHIGTKVADRGFTYLIFFLAMISVNLAVINFLPMPIVDGGLFLFLVYEKLKGRPPSIAFQNAATIVGLCLIGTIFLVTFYNDIVRLVS